jgi:hypothetical protein
MATNFPLPIVFLTGTFLKSGRDDNHLATLKKMCRFSFRESMISFAKLLFYEYIINEQDVNKKLDLNEKFVTINKRYQWEMI